MNLKKKYESLTSDHGRAEFIRIYGKNFGAGKPGKKRKPKKKKVRKLYTWKDYGKSKKEAYRNYLTSARWKRFKARIIAARGKECEQCHRTRGIQLHHKTYARVYNERSADMLLLCGRCHAETHNHLEQEVPHHLKYDIYG